MRTVRMMSFLAMSIAVGMGAIGCGTDGSGTKLIIRNDTVTALDPGIKTSLGTEGTPGTALSTGIMGSGTTKEFDFACVELGAVYSTKAQMLVGGMLLLEAGDSTILRRGDGFACGDVIEIRFIGPTSPQDPQPFVSELKVNGAPVN